jgi:hypothetical protein
MCFEITQLVIRFSLNHHLVGLGAPSPRSAGPLTAYASRTSGLGPLSKRAYRNISGHSGIFAAFLSLINSRLRLSSAHRDQHMHFAQGTSGLIEELSITSSSSGRLKAAKDQPSACSRLSRSSPTMASPQPMASSLTPCRSQDYQTLITTNGRPLSQICRHLS